jgi:hypothetical protein
VAVPSPGETLAVRRRPGAREADEPFPAVVVRSDVTGVWCSPLEGDQRFPLGPCRGATRVALTSSSTDGAPHAHTLTVERLPVRTSVLLLLTDDGPWVLNHDREVT